MYVLYIIDELYTFIENRWRTLTIIAYLSVRYSVCFPEFPPWKQFVSTGETNSFHGGNCGKGRLLLQLSYVMFVEEIRLLPMYRGTILCIEYT